MILPTKLFPALVVTSLVLSPAMWAEDKPANPPAAAPGAVATATPKPLPPQVPDVPAVKYDAKTGEPNKGFLSAHEKYVAIAKEGKAQLLFLGDSITAGWAGRGKTVWEKSFSQWQPANFGIGGDRTQHVLWRIENGELDGLKPKAAVVMIGTNNVGSDSPEAIAKGVTKIVETIRAKTPATKILLLAVFPRGEKASAPGKPNGAREKLAKVNEIISKLADNQHVFYLDIGAKFLQPDGSITKEIMPDFLHPSEAGYQIWADAITPKLTELMK
ncbi:MAG TPA: platelet-activating factor acetylhydrolase IB subunit [Chthoniobacter sp.]|jgi:lysophospholipase L1-like esterase